MKFTVTDGFKKYFINTSWLMLERILRISAALFVGVYVARYLGPQQFGLLSYAVSFVGLFGALATLGLDGIMVRELVKRPEYRNELLGTAFCLKLTGAVLMWVAVAGATHFSRNETETRTLIAIFAFAAIFQAFHVIEFNYQAEVNSKCTAFAQGLSLAFSSMTKVVLVWLKAPLVWFAWAGLFEACLLVIFLLVAYLRTHGRIWRWKYRTQVAGDLLKDSWPLILSGMVISIYMRIDQVMIKAMLGPEDVGFFAAAVKLSEAWYFVPVIISSSVFPAIINAKKQSETLYNIRIQKLYDLMVWTALAVALPTTLLAPWIIGILYGDAFLEASKILSIYIWASIFSFFGTARGKWLIIENLQRLGLYYLFMGCILNILCNYYLIRHLGVVGAAVSTVISLFSIVLFFPLFNKKVRPSVIMFLHTINLKRVFYAK